MSDSVLLADEHPIDPDDELLVAYLDGELNDLERRAVEKRLVSEPDFQKRMQSLEPAGSGWKNFPVKRPTKNWWNRRSS